MRKLIHWFALLAAVACCGCTALNQAPATATTINYGPFPERYRTIIAAYMGPFLHDPDSATYQNWRGPNRGFLTTATGIVYGYRVCADLDFRNKLGSYTGSRSYLFLISNDLVVAHEGGHKAGSVEAELLARICKLDK
jgi:hypothetical protein